MDIKQMNHPIAKRSALEIKNSLERANFKKMPFYDRPIWWHCSGAQWQWFLLEFSIRKRPSPLRAVVLLLLRRNFCEVTLVKLLHLTLSMLIHWKFRFSHRFIVGTESGQSSCASLRDPRHSADH